MNHYHKRNKSNWDDFADNYKLRVDRYGTWDKCHLDPTVAFTASEMEAFGDVGGKKIAVLGSGANEVTFALVGMGAIVTSVDISEYQLRHARARAESLDLKAFYTASDVVNLGLLAESFDALHTGGSVACWVSDLDRYYAEAARVLKSGGILVLSEYHPIRTIWSSSEEHLIVEKPYGDIGPYLEEGNEGDPYVFNWTVSDYVNAVLNAGFDLLKFEEMKPDPDKNVEWWKTHRKIQLKYEGLPQDILLVGRKK